MKNTSTLPFLLCLWLLALPASNFDLAEALNLGSSISSIDSTFDDQTVAAADAHKVNIIKKKNGSLEVAYTIDDGDHPTYVQFSLDANYLYTVWQEGLGILYQLNASNAYSELLRVTADRSGGSFAGALRHDVQKIVLCEYEKFKVFSVDFSAGTATLTLRKTVASLSAYPNIEISSASIIKSYIILGVYYGEAKSTIELYFDYFGFSLGYQSFVKYPRFRLPNHFSTAMEDLENLNNLGEIEFEGDNLFCSLSEDQKTVVISSTRKTYIIKDALHGSSATVFES